MREVDENLSAGWNLNALHENGVPSILQLQVGQDDDFAGGPLTPAEPHEIDKKRTSDSATYLLSSPRRSHSHESSTVQNVVTVGARSVLNVTLDASDAGSCAACAPADALEMQPVVAPSMHPAPSPKLRYTSFAEELEERKKSVQ